MRAHEFLAEASQRDIEALLKAQGGKITVARDFSLLRFHVRHQSENIIYHIDLVPTDPKWSAQQQVRRAVISIAKKISGGDVRNDKIEVAATTVGGVIITGETLSFLFNKDWKVRGYKLASEMKYRAE